MSTNPNDARAALKHAFQLIKAGEKQQARKIVSEFLKAYPRSADGWYLAALVTDEPEKKLKIVERVLEINPQHSEGNKLLKELTAGDDMLNDLLRETEEPDPKSEPKPKSAPANALPKGASDFLKGRAFWIAIAVLAQFIIFGSIFVFGQSRGEILGIVFRASITPRPTNTPLPTFTPTPTHTSTPTSTPTYTPSPTFDLTETAVVEYRKIQTAIAMTLVAIGNSSQNGQPISPLLNLPTLTPYVFPTYTPSATPENTIQKDVVPLNYIVRDAAYDSALQKIIMISDSSTLHIYDPETNNDKMVNLPRETLSLSMSPDGMFAAVGHDALVSYVDLKNAKLIKTLNVTVPVNHLVLAGNGWVYIEDQTSFETIVGVEITTDKQVKGPQISGDTVLRLSPNGQKIYGADQGISPDDIYRIDIGPQGFATPNQNFAISSPYHGDYAICGDLWFSQDGQRIFTACGAVFRSSDNPQQDMTYNGSIYQDAPRLSYVTHSQAAGIVLGLNGAEERQDKMGVWDYENLTLKKMMTLPNYDAKRASFGRFVFINPTSTRYYVIVWTFKSAGVHDFGLFGGDISELNGTVAQVSAGPLTPTPQPTTTQGAVTGLNFNVIDAAYSTALDRIIAISDNPNQLHIYNPTNHSDTAVDLSSTALSLSLSSDGLFAAVGHSALISYVDLKNSKLIKTLNIPIPVNYLILAGNGWIYAERNGEFERMAAVEIATDRQIEGTRIMGVTILRLHPDGQKIYGANRGLSPDDIARVDLSLDGFANPDTRAKDSRYHGDYAMCGNLWFSPDGQRIYTACGAVFSSSDDIQQDMTYIGTLVDTQFVNGAPPDVPGIRNLIQTGGLVMGIPLPESPTTNTGVTMPEDRLAVWNASNLTIREMVPLEKWSVKGQTYPSNGRFVFVNAAGNQYYVIVQAGEEAGLLHDFGIITGKVSDL